MHNQLWKSTLESEIALKLLFFFVSLFVFVNKNRLTDVWIVCNSASNSICSNHRAPTSTQKLVSYDGLEFRIGCLLLGRLTVQSPAPKFCINLLNPKGSTASNFQESYML